MSSLQDVFGSIDLTKFWEVCRYADSSKKKRTLYDVLSVRFAVDGSVQNTHNECAEVWQVSASRAAQLVDSALLIMGNYRYYSDFTLEKCPKCGLPANVICRPYCYEHFGGV